MSQSFDLKPGTIIQGYRVVRCIGQGGFGAVYELVHCQFARRAALKVLSLPSSRPEITARFLNEARAANAVRHPGTVQIFEIGQLANGAPWLLMEFIEGETLEERIEAIHNRTAPLLHDSIAILYQLTDVLRMLHERGVIHRDLKPANIKLMPDPSRPEGELAKLLDFGIAKFVSESLLEPQDEGPAPPQTRAGVIMGTPSYMAPEQCVSSATVTAAADVYALGVIAYEMLAGTKPFTVSPPAIYTAKLTQDPPPLDNGIPFELRSLVMTMLHRDPAQRPSMAQAGEILARLGGRGASGAQLRAMASNAEQAQTQARASHSVRAGLLIGLGLLAGGLVTTTFVLFLIRPSGHHIKANVPPVSVPVPVEDAGSYAGNSAQNLDQRDAAATAATEQVKVVLPTEDTPPVPPDLGSTPPQRPDLGSSNSSHPPACLAQKVRADCFVGAGLTAEQREVLSQASGRVNLRLCASQSIKLSRVLGGFLTCDQLPAAIPQRVCENFIHTADALWRPNWNIPERVEIRCPSR